MSHVRFKLSVTDQVTTVLLCAVNIGQVRHREIGDQGIWGTCTTQIAVNFHLTWRISYKQVHGKRLRQALYYLSRFSSSAIATLAAARRQDKFTTVRASISVANS